MNQVLKDFIPAIIGFTLIISLSITFHYVQKNQKETQETKKRLEKLKTQ